VTSAPDTVDDGDTLPPPDIADDAKPAAGNETTPTSDNPSVVKCEEGAPEDSEDRPTWRPFPVVPRSPTGFSGTFEAVPSSRQRFPRRRVG
jgi:hypothetical protein